MKFFRYLPNANLTGCAVSRTIVTQRRHLSNHEITTCGLTESLSESISRRCLWIMHSFAVTYANITIDDISLKLDSLSSESASVSIAESIGVSSTTFT